MVGHVGSKVEIIARDKLISIKAFIGTRLDLFFFIYKRIVLFN